MCAWDDRIRATVAAAEERDARRRLRSITPARFVDMALYVGSDIDLGNASDDELYELFVEAVAAGFGFDLPGGVA